jgi:DNA-directed RNA polymerase subunit alpha
MDSPLDHSVEDLEISVRAWNVLNQFGIAYVGELVQWTEHDLLQHPSSSKKIVGELREFLAQMGLSLGTPQPEWKRPDGAAVALPTGESWRA